MYNLDAIVRMYFTSVSTEDIFTEKIKYDAFSQQEFAGLCRAYMTHYSDTEGRQMFCYAKSSADEEGHVFSGMHGRSALNVFAAVEELAEQLLILENDEVRCKYRNLLRFREVSRYVEEDLFVCAYFAMHHVKYGKIHTDFSWNTTIEHNNLQLRRIMEKGISENHFHLYGSAPFFHMLWIHFMNHVDCSAMPDFAAGIQSAQRTSREHYNVQYTEDSFEVNVLKAALIRAHIILYLLKDEIGEADESYDLRALLNGNLDVRHYYYEIQGTINRIQNYVFLFNYEGLMDYALYMVKDIDDASAERHWFAGERFMMYKMLQKELKGDGKKDREYYQWFYAYLALKYRVRSELIQVNDTVGFENFQIYSRRKNYYTDYKKMIGAAIYGSMESGNIKSLEIRISPRESAAANAENIQEIETVMKGIKKLPFHSPHYYVFHFSKEEDEMPEKYVSVCRHFSKRQRVEKQAMAIADFRENYRKTAAKVLGIDACSQEIGCRPEVFAPMYRFLSKHMAENIEGLRDSNVRQLRKTYHVGEDFLDVADGLRAIDEAVHFLDLQCGDRIGHGTVLGIDVKKWYCIKQNTILLPKQDYLDNVVWLYHKLAEYEISGMDNLRVALEKEFERCFSEIYLHMEDGNIREHLRGDIHTYYEAWKLRGDEPQLYYKGYFDRNEMLDRRWFLNEKYPELFGNRNRREIAGLYYLYHYDYNVRCNGKAVTQVYITPSQVEGICLIQKAMQKEFAAYGIGIETNPSSNFAISTMQGYDEHPIVVLYNNGLTEDTEKISGCPQVNVSINTDDKGVFHTSLENEYALMACAMEKVEDSRGDPLYNRQMVYQWIDHIRELGNMQSFKGKECKKRKWKVRFKK